MKHVTPYLRPLLLTISISLLTACGGGNQEPSASPNTQTPTCPTQPITPPDTPKTKQLSTVNAGVDREVKKGTTVTMVGTYVGDFKDVMSYVWQEEGTVLSHSISFPYTPQSIGEHNLTLTIKDQHGHDYSDSILVHAQPAGQAMANHVHHAQTAMLAHAKLNESVELHGGYTGETDPDITYVWKKGERVLSREAKVRYIPHSLGKHLLTLTITDSLGYTDQAAMTLFTIGGSTDKTVNLDSNGGTDNDAQINAALQEVADAGGGTVHLNPGTYVIENPIVFKGDNTILEGAGSDTTIIRLKENADWGHMVGTQYLLADPIITNTKDALHNLAIMNLQIDGNKYNQTYQFDSDGDGVKEEYPVSDGIGNYVGVEFSARNGSENVSNLLFSNVFINRNNGDALDVKNPTNSIVEKCKARYIGHSSVYFYNPTNMLVEKNDFLITANSGVRWYDGNHIVVKDNLLEGETTKTGNSNFGIEVTSGQTPDVLDDVLIEGNTIRFTAGAGIALDGKTPTTSRDVIIRNNIIYQCGNVGTWANQRETGAINLKNFTNTLIENNTIVNTIGGAIRLGGNVGFNSDWDSLSGLTATIQNNIVTHSLTDAEVPQKIDVYGVDIAKGNSALCQYNNLWKNGAGNYRGCTIGAGNISEDPHFQAFIPGDTFNNTHDTDADFHLKSQAGRYRAGNWVRDTISSSAINAGDPNTAYYHEPSTNGNRVNMGAYGNTPEASKGVDAPPIANAGNDQYLRADQKGFVYVDLDGSGSFDNGRIQRYAWVKDGYAIGEGQRLPRVPMGIGEHQIQLTVTDNSGHSTATSIRVLVRPATPNKAPTADAGEDIFATDRYGTGVKVTLDATKSFDEDGVLVDYRWYERGTQLSHQPKDVVTFAEGTHTVTLEVTDNEGKKSTDTLTVTVRPKGNYALRFNEGSNDEYVSINNVQTPEANLTIEMWIKQEETTGDTDALISLGSFDGQRLTLRPGVGGGASWGLTHYASGDITLNEWYHLAFVVANKQLQNIYLDGVAQSIQGDRNITMPGSVFQIASFYQNTADAKNFKGLIDELRIWSSARTVEQINANKDRELTGTEANLIGYWNFNDGSGKKLMDLTGGSDGNVMNMEAEDWVEGDWKY